MRVRCPCPGGTARRSARRVLAAWPPRSCHPPTGRNEDDLVYIRRQARVLRQQGFRALLIPAFVKVWPPARLGLVQRDDLPRCGKRDRPAEGRIGRFGQGSLLVVP